MSQKVLIVSSTNSLSSALTSSLEEALPDLGYMVLIDNPPASTVRKIIDSNFGSVAAVIVDLADRASGLSLLRGLSNSHPGILLAAADTAPSADTILESMRSGASEFLAPPFDLSSFAQSLRRHGHTNGTSRKPGRLLCFLPAQSANGASTVALHVAHAAACEMEWKVLLVELDFHAGTLTQRLKLKPERTLADVIDRTDVVHELWDKVVCPWKGIDILPAPPSSRSMANKTLQNLPDLLQAATAVYAAVVVDLPSPLFSSSRQVLTFADAVYLVCTPDVMSLHLTRRKVFELTNLGIRQDLIHLVVNRAGSSQVLQTEDVSKVVGLPVEFLLDNDYSAITQAALRGELVPKGSTLGRQLYDLGRHALGIEKEDPSGGRRKWGGLFPFQKALVR